VIGLLVVILAATAVGAIGERRHTALAEAAARHLITILVKVALPFIVFFVTSRLHLHGGVGIGLLLGYVVLAVTGAAAYLVGTRLLDLPRPAVGALICCAILANSGYLGIALNAQLLGQHAIAPAVAWDAIVGQITLFAFAFAVGAAFGTDAGETPRERAWAFFTRNPVLYALIAGLLVPDRLAPEACVEIARFIASYGLVPIGFFILGVHLMAEEEAGTYRMPPLTTAVGAAIGLRMVLAPLLMLGLSLAIIEVPHAYLLQAAMPSGINTLIVAHVYGLDLRLSAGAIAWSTIAALIVAVVVAVAT
jgi:predicted permease